VICSGYDPVPTLHIQHSTQETGILPDFALSALFTEKPESQALYNNNLRKGQ